MSRAVVQHIRRGLADTSQNLSQWLETSPVDEKERTQHSKFIKAKFTMLPRI